MSNLKNKKNLSNTVNNATENVTSTVANTVANTTNTVAEMAQKVKPNFGANKNVTFMFNKKNYTIMLIGLAVIILGFILMAGGKSADPNVFNYDEIYSFRRITLAPILVMAGFVIEIFAIMRVPKPGEE